MQPFYKRFSVITGFAALLLLLLANGLVIRQQLATQVENQSWVRHTAEVLLQLSDTESLLKDAETGQRGYLYTGDPQYLTPYTLAVSQIDKEIDKLAELTGDNPAEQARIAQLRLLANKKLQELSATLALYQSGHPDEAHAGVLTNQGLLTMVNIRALVDAMQAEETSLDATRIEAYRRSVRVTVACIYVASLLAALGLILLAYFILHEMTLRERHAAQIRQREEWFRVTLTSIGDGVIATDGIGYVTFINPIAEGLTGVPFSEGKGQLINDVFPIFNEVSLQPVENPVRKVMQLGNIVGLANHTVVRHRNGSLIPIEDSAAPIRDDAGKLVGVVLVFRDATADRKSQEILRKTEKIAAAARLAATVAHEINNPLEAVSNLVYLAKLRPGMPDQALEDLNLAEQELNRVSHVTRQTLGFYREANQPDKLDVPTIVESVLRLYSNKFKTKNIQVVHDLEPCPPLQGYPGELQQVVANIISNAADAVETGGTLKVSVSCVDGDGGKTVQVRVEDNGSGIAAQHLDRIFEPFFTTKKNVGTGLGLWVSKTIVERHGGTIAVESHNDIHSHGTVFNVLIPCSPSFATRAARASS
ncbi:MAG TPA: CHASE3 domain-containing protein [Terriglobales bacterium]|jgi:PAS domain S-box-containing protein